MRRNRPSQIKQQQQEVLKESNPSKDPQIHITPAQPVTLDTTPQPVSIATSGFHGETKAQGDSIQATGGGDDLNNLDGDLVNLDGDLVKPDGDLITSDPIGGPATAMVTRKNIDLDTNQLYPVAMGGNPVSKQDNSSDTAADPDVGSVSRREGTVTGESGTVTGESGTVTMATITDNISNVTIGDSQPAPTSNITESTG